MTATELAAMLDGAEYGHEVTKELAAQAKQDGLVIVYGASDDLMEFEGAIEYEADAYGGRKIHLGKHGILACPLCDTEWQDCPYYQAALDKAKTVEAVWCGDDADAAWTYKTEVPHACFNVYEDGELYCVGIVFSMEDL